MKDFVLSFFRSFVLSFFRSFTEKDQPISSFLLHSLFQKWRWHASRVTQRDCRKFTAEGNGMTRKQPDMYTVLGARSDASPRELRLLYQQKAMQFHPDRLGPEASDEERLAGQQRFVELQRSWETLSNEDARRMYDAQRREESLAQPYLVHARLSLEDMEWNEVGVTH
uniref:J domain-containing protein n=1 Tax=Eptatretus burgeri TaxID=7764 RepID=A0A8C4QGG8_EPTBU